MGRNSLQDSCKILQGINFQSSRVWRSFLWKNFVQKEPYKSRRAKNMLNFEAVCHISCRMFLRAQTRSFVYCLHCVRDTISIVVNHSVASNTEPTETSTEQTSHEQKHFFLLNSPPDTFYPCRLLHCARVVSVFWSL